MRERDERADVAFVWGVIHAINILDKASNEDGKKALIAEVDRLRGLYGRETIDGCRVLF